MNMVMDPNSCACADALELGTFSLMDVQSLLFVFIGFASKKVI